MYGNLVFQFCVWSRRLSRRVPMVRMDERAPRRARSPLGRGAHCLLNARELARGRTVSARCQARRRRGQDLCRRRRAACARGGDRAPSAAVNTQNEAPPSSDDEDDAGPLVSFAKTTSEWSSPSSLLPLVVAPEGRGRATGALRSSRSRGSADAVCQATPSALPRCSSSAPAPSSRHDGPGCGVTAGSSRLPARGLRVEPTREETAGRGARV